MSWAIKKAVLLLVALFLAVPAGAGSGYRERREFLLPAPPGYRAVRCDLHMHTVFSDGRVWPTLRVEEAWRDGLDALAISEHVEKQSYAEDIPPNIDRSCELARPLARQLGMLLFRGAEITRSLPQGHYNAIFLERARSLKIEKFEEAMAEAARQGAFLFWNHPGWPRPDLRARWTAVQERLLERGHLHGIEVVNGKTYFPNAHRWCLEKKLTMLANSDLHDPVETDENLDAGRRPFTIVLAKRKTKAAIKKALFARRTVLVHGDRLIGEEEYLRPIFERSVHFDPQITVLSGRAAELALGNRSSMPFLLQFGALPGLDLPRELVLEPGGTTRLRLAKRAGPGVPRGKIEIPFSVANLQIGPDRVLKSSFRIEFP